MTTDTYLEDVGDWGQSFAPSYHRYTVTLEWRWDYSKYPFVARYGDMPYTATMLYRRYLRFLATGDTVSMPPAYTRSHAYYLAKHNKG